jgi:hypothetical protein
MPYIGKTPVIGNFIKLDSITTVNGQASYTMQNGGTNFTAYANVNQFLVSLNGVVQAPTDSFTVSGSTITFASNLVTGDVIDFIIVLGNTLDVGVPSDNTVSLAKLTATGTKNSTTFLRGDNTFAEAGGGLLACYYNQWNTQYTASGTTVTTIFTGDNLTLASTSSKVLFLADLSLGAVYGGSIGMQYSTDNGSTYNDITTLDMLDTDNNQLNGKAMIGLHLNATTTDGSRFMVQDSFSYLHSPNSTQVRYRLVMAASVSSGYTITNNRRGGGGMGGISHVTQMEIGV